MIIMITTTTTIIIMTTFDNGNNYEYHIIPLKHMSKTGRYMYISSDS